MAKTCTRHPKETKTKRGKVRPCHLTHDKLMLQPQVISIVLCLLSISFVFYFLHFVPKKEEQILVGCYFGRHPKGKLILFTGFLQNNAFSK